MSACAHSWGLKLGMLSVWHCGWACAVSFGAARNLEIALTSEENWIFLKNSEFLIKIIFIQITDAHKDYHTPNV